MAVRADASAALTPSLDALHDIVAAPASGWWPPAPGWWLLALLLLTALLRAAPTLRRRWQRYRLRRSALRELADLYRRWRAGGDARDFSAALSTLLKRALLSGLAPSRRGAATAATPAAERTAALYGRRWQRYLDATGFDADAAALLADAPYRRATAADPAATERLYRAARRWLRAAG